jgi:tetratricopeptide (TPR) repeat protein
MTKGRAMPAWGRIVRGLLLGLAVLTLPLAWGCGSGSATEAETNEIVNTATNLAQKQELAIGRAWAMGQVATAWAAVDLAGARQAVADSIEAAEEAAAGGDEQRSVAADLRQQSTDWTPTDWRGAIALAERIERNSSRAWVLRAIAGELVDQDPSQATSLLATAMGIAQSNPLPQYSAEDESTVAVQMAGVNPAEALRAAGAIADSATKARALREIARQLSEEGSARSASALEEAITAAREISDPYDRAWALRESALVPGVEDSQARQLLGEAEDAAEQIADAEPQEYALSDVAVAWAPLDLEQAMATAGRIGDFDPQARVDAFIGIAQARLSASDSGGAQTALEGALSANEGVLDVYERARAVNVIVTDMAPVDYQRALELARGITDPYLQADALRFLAEAEAAEKPDDAVALAEEIEPAYVRVQALTAIGETVAGSDQEKAVDIFTKALSEAGDLKDTYPLRLLASAWAPLDPAKALGVAEQVEDDQDKVVALTDVALAMLDTDPAKAHVVFEEAYETAQKVKSEEDPFASATVLLNLAAAWLPVDKAEAVDVYAAAFEAAAAVSVEQSAG